MTRTVSAYEARTKLGEIMNLVYYQGVDFIVERRGEPVVKIVRVGKRAVKNGKRRQAMMKFAGIWAGKDGDKIRREAMRLRRTAKFISGKKWITS